MKKLSVEYLIDWVFRYKYYWKIERISKLVVLVYVCNSVWVMSNDDVLELLGEDYYDLIN